MERNKKLDSGRLEPSRAFDPTRNFVEGEIPLTNETPAWLTGLLPGEGGVRCATFMSADLLKQDTRSMCAGFGLHFKPERNSVTALRSRTPGDESLTELTSSLHQ